jgi:hypothetical protein
MTAKRTIGNLESVPIRKVWADEARDFTPWLAENTDRLSEALGMDLELEGTEIGVGRFSADIVLRDASTGLRVVVENMINETDHDHLGKIITYAAGLEATYAVLIAEKFRPEHRSALQWLNVHSTESAGFFGVTLKVWQIGDSAYAPQLDVVVEPDGWVREVRAASTDALSGAPLHHRDFWNEFIPEFHEAHPGWSRARTPPKVNWMWFPAGRTGMAYSVSFCRPDKRYQFRLELYIDTGDTEGTAQVFSALVKRRNEIEKIFGESLEWEPLGDRRASRIASYYRDDVRVREREKWPSLRKWAIERMGVFREALQPHLDALDQPGDSGLKPRMGGNESSRPR